MNNKRKCNLLLCCGLLGSILMAASDYLMIWGDTAYSGSLAWLTVGASAISPARNGLAMLLAFPAVLLYAAGLLAYRYLIVSPVTEKRYVTLTLVGMTPWLCLHLFYVMILYLFSWLCGQGQQVLALQAGEAMFAHFSWLVTVGQLIMAVPFLYVLAVTVFGKTLLPRSLAVVNPVFLLVLLKALTGLLPDSPFRLAFTNGLMSEAMAIWFLVLLIWNGMRKK